MRTGEFGPSTGEQRVDYSHSMVAGGFEEMSYATRLIPGTSLITRVEIFASRS